MKGRSRKLHIALFVVALLSVLGCLAVWRVTSVAAVQDSLERDWEINFNEGGCPRVLPARLDEAAQYLIWRLLGPEREPVFFAEKANRDAVWRERVRALFRGRITAIEIYYPDRLRDDLGSALARFVSLHRLKIHNRASQTQTGPMCLAGFGVCRPWRNWRSVATNLAIQRSSHWQVRAAFGRSQSRRDG